MEPAREIPLSQGSVAIVDAADYHAVMAFKWYIVNGHAARNVREPDGNWKTQYLHTFLTGLPLVDHRNRNGLDNRRANLREATHAENMRNRGLGRNNTSGFKGVSWHTTGKKWQAKIKVDGKGRHLGLFRTAEEAALAYDVAALELHGEFAWLNFPDIDPRIREATHAENQRRQGFYSHNTSGFKGVTWHKPRGKWQAQMRVDGKNCYLGMFPTAEDAASAYDAAARELHGDRAWLNFPEAVVHHPTG